MASTHRAPDTGRERPSSGPTVLLVLAALAALPAAAAGQEPGPGRPAWSRVALLEPEGQTSANVSIGDVNGDGHPDLVLARGRHWPLANRVLLGDGRGGFSAGTDLGPDPDRTYSALLADLDQDGDLDIVVSNDRPDPKRVYLNDGTGRFREGTRYGNPDWSTRNAAVADLNGDGLPDIVVANRTGPGPGANYLCLNRGQGRFDGDCQVFSDASATTITPADFNGDGLTDLAVPHRDRGQSFVHLREPGTAPAFRRIPFGPPHAAIRVSAAADLDRDGRMDLAAVDERQGTILYFALPDGGYAEGVPVPGQGTPYALAVGDLDRDGDPDLVVGYVETPPVAYLNDGTGREYAPVRFGDGKGTAYGFAIGDLDGDGRPDIAMARSDAPNVVHFADP